MSQLFFLDGNSPAHHPLHQTEEMAAAPDMVEDHMQAHHPHGDKVVHGLRNGMTCTGHSPCLDHDLLFVHDHIPLAHGLRHLAEIASRQTPDTAGVGAQATAAIAAEAAVLTETGAAIDIKQVLLQIRPSGFRLSHSNGG
jgi:hypothetical protein